MHAYGRAGFRIRCQLALALRRMEEELEAGRPVAPSDAPIAIVRAANERIAGCCSTPSNARARARVLNKILLARGLIMIASSSRPFFSLHVSG